jgi:ferredoxin
MTFVITSPCLDTKDKACVDVCPVDCIHFDEKSDLMLYINPIECIDCGACEPACPVNAIFEEGGVPDDQNHFIEINALWYDDPDAARIKISSDTVAAPTAVKDIIETKKEPELIETTSVEKEISQDSSANEKDAQKEKPIVVSASSISAPTQIEAVSVKISNQQLPSPASILAIVPFVLLFIFSWLFPGPIIASFLNLEIGIITILCFFIGNIFLLLFFRFEGISLAKFSAMGNRDILKWRDKPTDWRRSEESRRLEIESVIEQIALNSFAYPNNEYPSLKTFINLPNPELGIEIVGGLGGRIYPDIIVAEQPSNYPRLIAQIESAETVTREQAERVWARLDNQESTTYIFVPTGYAARAKDYARVTGIKNIQIRTWKRSGSTIRVLVT